MEVKGPVVECDINSGRVIMAWDSILQASYYYSPIYKAHPYTIRDEVVKSCNSINYIAYGSKWMRCRKA